MFSRLKFFYLVSFLIFFVSFLFSNDIRVTASVASQDVFLGEQLYYYVNIEGGSGSNIPEIKKLDNVDIYRVGNSVQMSLINGHMSTNVKITYILTPREEGKIIIPPVTVKTNKRTYSSNSVVINVIKNANQSSNNQNNIKNSNYNNQNYDNFVNEENEKQNQNQTKTTNKRNVFITSFVDKKEAKDFAFEQSCDLIRNTSIIMNKYERMAQETGLDVDIFVKNDATYEIYEVQDKHLSQEQLQREFSQDYEKFIDKYCS